jgi:hypothetical protein
MFGNILGRASGGGGGGDENSTLAPVNHDIFDDGDAAADFENMLIPPVGAATITQPQRGGVPPLPQGGPTLGSNLWGYHYHLRWQGGGTHHHPHCTYQGKEEMQASNRRRGTSHTPASAPQ